MIGSSGPFPAIIIEPEMASVAGTRPIVVATMRFTTMTALIDIENCLPVIACTRRGVDLCHRPGEVRPDMKLSSFA
jgi:hypothetical protein